MFSPADDPNPLSGEWPDFAADLPEAVDRSLIFEYHTSAGSRTEGLALYDDRIVVYTPESPRPVTVPWNELRSWDIEDAEGAIVIELRARRRVSTTVPVAFGSSIRRVLTRMTAE